MKNTLLLTAFLLFNISFSQTKHIGEWRGTDDEGRTRAIIFDDTRHVMLVLGDETIGGADFEVNGSRGELKYEVDYSKDPVWVDFVGYAKGNPKEIGRMKGIIRFLSDTKMELRMDPHGARYTAFDNDKDHTVILEKVK